MRSLRPATRRASDGPATMAHMPWPPRCSAPWRPRTGHSPQTLGEVVATESILLPKLSSYLVP